MGVRHSTGWLRTASCALASGSSIAAVLGTTDDGAVAGIDDRHHHLIGIPLAVHHVDQPGHRPVAGGLVQDGPGRVDAVDPLAALFLLGARLARLGPRPVLLVQDADDLSRAVTAKAVCKCTPRASPPESIGPSSGIVLQRGKVQRGGVLDDEQDVLVEAPPGGFKESRGQTQFFIS